MKILSAPFVLFAFASAATAAMAASRSPYGACAHLPRDEFEQRDGILRLMREAGIANVRFDIDWTAWEKNHALPRVAARGRTPQGGRAPRVACDRRCRRQNALPGARASSRRDQNLSVQRNAKIARKIAAVASYAAVGGYATSRHFQSTVLGPTKKREPIVS